MPRDSTYSPFASQLSSLTGDDLAVLKEVQEGWYIEYKEALPNPSSIAKSVGAFANTHGGFLFFGIREESKEHPVAGEYVGLSEEQAANGLMQIRQAVSAHLSPAPHFNSKKIDGPCSSIGLESGRTIICIEVPWSPQAPHVHKSGVIHRRVADSSEPRAENDRYILDELFKRSDKKVEQVRQWYLEDPRFTEREESSPYLRLLFTTDPYGQRRPWLQQTFKELKAILNAEGAITPFDSVYTTARGIVGRQTKGNDPTNWSMTMFIDRDLTVEVLVPLPLTVVSHPGELKKELEGYAYVDEFVSVLNQWGFNSLKVLDLNQLFAILWGIFRAYHRMLEAAGWTEEYRVLMKPLNLARLVPFFDIESVLNSYKEDGVPVFLKNCALNLDFHHPQRFLSFRKESEEGGYSLEYANAANCLLWLGEDLGISSMGEREDGFEALLDDLDEASTRSSEAQRLRGLRERGLDN